ncbi:MAG: hypothetical protein BroJett011_63010 [Chloroflexota bacterium]|nr:MAG: hypothetical protein BroJett011_63010 [Chloroflexota bacterium]
MPHISDPVVQKWQDDARWFLETKTKIQADLAAAGLGPPASLAPLWKAAAKKYYALAAELDSALVGSEQIVAALAAERAAARARIAELEITVRSLRADLWEFGDHQRGCARLKTPTAEAGCTCGYHRALARGAEVSP